MASLPSHAIAALGIGALFCHASTSKRILVAGAVCSLVPDFDVIGFRFGIRYGDFWGHRGFTHSLLFAAFLSSIVLFVLLRNSAPGPSRLAIWTYLFLATASHGLLDAMTDGGLGVAFFSPFDTSRYFFPWRPIHVSPIGVSRFFSSRGLYVFRSELLYIWLPSGLVIVLAYLVRRLRARQLESTGRR